MATKQQLTEEFFTCIVCHEVFTDPVTLHCGHTLCAECINGYLKTQDQAIVAEQCCDVCLEDGNLEPAISYCIDCRKDFCRVCDAFHKKMMKNHKSQKSTEAAAGKVQQKTRFCPEHAGSPVDMMCEDCDKVLCQKCCIVYHRRCESVTTLKQAVTKIDDVLEKELLTLEQDIGKLKTGVSLTYTKVEMLEESADKAEKDLDATCEKLVSLVVTNQKQMKEKIARTKESAVQVLKADVKNEEMKLENAQQKQGLIRQALKSGVPMDHYEMYRICSPGQVEYQSTERSSERITQIDFSQNKMKDVLKHLEESGIGDVNTTKHLDSSECKKKTNASASVPSHEDDIKKRKYRLLRSFDTGLQSLCGIVVLNFGNTKVVVCAGYKNVKAFYEQNRKPQQSCLFFQTCIKDLCKVHDSEAAILVNKGLKLIHIKSKPTMVEDIVIQLPRAYDKIATKGRKYYAFYNEVDEITDSRFKGLDILNTAGEVTQTISASMSSFLVTSNELIFYTNGSFVYCVNEEGHKQLKHECQGSYVALCLLGENTEDEYVVFSSIRKAYRQPQEAAVAFLTQEGTFCLLNEEQLRNLQNEPYCFPKIAADKDGLLYLSRTEGDNDDVRMHVFGF